MKLELTVAVLSVTCGSLEGREVGSPRDRDVRGGVDLQGWGCKEQANTTSGSVLGPRTLRRLGCVALSLSP